MELKGNDEIRRVLMVGDTHGNDDHWEKVVVPSARSRRTDIILQLGDFGYWPRISDGERFLAWVDRSLQELSRDLGREMVCVFVDGNHEDHLELNKLAPRSDGFVPVTDRILWAPRGLRWEWAGVRFLALGGAFSIDRKYRAMNSGHYGWFGEEMITTEQASIAMDGGECDVLVSHDAPLWCRQFLIPVGVPAVGLFPDSDANSKLLQDVVRVVKPKQLWHGHYHSFVDVELDISRPFSSDPKEPIRIVGLACDELDKSCSLLTLPELTITHFSSLAIDGTPLIDSESVNLT